MPSYREGGRNEPHGGHHTACSRAVSVARVERVRRGAAVPADGTDSANYPKPPAGPTFTLSGVITERFSGRPVQGAGVSLWPFQAPRWPPDGPALRYTASDGAGRYTVSGLPSVGPVWVVAWPAGDAFSAPYVHQCVTTVTVEGDATLDVTVSSTTDLVALNASTGPASPDSRMVSGTVSEITANGRQPVRNTLVGWRAPSASGLDDFFMAETRTDAAEHYRLCGLPRERITLLAVPTHGSFFSASVDPGSDAIVDIEIARK
jgi:hypothetical protein